MIHIEGVHKTYRTRHGTHTVLNGIDLKIKRGEKIGILGRNGAGKSTLIRLISGAEQPTSGHIRRDMRVSWPLAFSGGFQGSLTGVDNTRFVCRIYGTDVRQAVEFVEEFAELGEYLHEPVKHYSSGMRARLAFALSMAIEFDCYLIDEVIIVGDSRFHEKCHRELFEKRKDRGIILVTHDLNYFSSVCEHGSVLRNGQLSYFEDVKGALDYYAEA